MSPLPVSHPGRNAYPSGSPCSGIQLRTTPTSPTRHASAQPLSRIVTFTPSHQTVVFPLVNTQDQDSLQRSVTALQATFSDVLVGVVRKLHAPFWWVLHTTLLIGGSQPRPFSGPPHVAPSVTTLPCGALYAAEIDAPTDLSRSTPQGRPPAAARSRLHVCRDHAVSGSCVVIAPTARVCFSPHVGQSGPQ